MSAVRQLYPRYRSRPCLMRDFSVVPGAALSLNFDGHVDSPAFRSGSSKCSVSSRLAYGWLAAASPRA
jgi:hypothetical protein